MTGKRSHGVIYAAFCIAISIQYLYLFSFNWAPALRLPLSSSLALLHIVLAGMTILLRPASWNLLILLSTGMLTATLIPAHFMGYGEVSGFEPAAAVRLLVVPLIMIWILAYPLALPRSLLWWCAFLGTLAGTAIAFTGVPVLVSGTPRLGSITGGLEQMHPSAKFVALQLVLLDLLRRAGIMRPGLSWSLIALSFFVLIQYGGRNEQLFVIVYYLALLYFSLNRITLIRWSPLFGVALGLMGAYIAFQLGTNVERWGSGRIGAWVYRIDLLIHRDLIPLLFGGGIGSDKIWTPIWGHNDEGLIAHNDYLYLLMEHGVFGLFFFASYIFGLWIRCFDEGRAILIAMLVNSFFANGFFRSPLLATSLTLVLAISMVASLHRMERAVEKRQIGTDEGPINSRGIPSHG